MLTNPAHPRHVKVTLSGEQQRELIPLYTEVVRAQLGLGERGAGAIVVEALAQLTPDTARSELTLFRTITAEMDAYRTDPAAYEARAQATSYEVPALSGEVPEGLGAISFDLYRLYVPCTVPHDAARLGEWWHFAHHYPDGGKIDGPALAEKIGWDLDELGRSMHVHYQRTGQWLGNLVDQRLTLLFLARLERFVEGTEHEAAFRAEVQSLLTAIGQLQPSHTVN